MGDLREGCQHSLSAKPSNRPCSQPKDEGLPNLHPGQLIQLLTEVYGLVSGPAWWRSTFLQITRYGYKICPYEPRIMVLPGSTPGSNTEGALVIEVDDVVECGSTKHRDCMSKLESEITSVKWPTCRRLRPPMRAITSGSCLTFRLLFTWNNTYIRACRR